MLTLLRRSGERLRTFRSSSCRHAAGFKISISKVQDIGHFELSPMRPYTSTNLPCLFQIQGLNVNYTESGLFGFVAAAHPGAMDKVSMIHLKIFLKNSFGERY